MTINNVVKGNDVIYWPGLTQHHISNGKIAMVFLQAGELKEGYWNGSVGRSRILATFFLQTADLQSPAPESKLNLGPCWPKKWRENGILLVLSLFVYKNWEHSLSITWKPSTLLSKRPRTHRGRSQLVERKHQDTNQADHFCQKEEGTQCV